MGRNPQYVPTPAPLRPHTPSITPSRQRGAIHFIHHRQPNHNSHPLNNIPLPPPIPLLKTPVWQQQINSTRTEPKRSTPPDPAPKRADESPPRTPSATDSPAKSPITAIPMRQRGGSLRCWYSKNNHVQTRGRIVLRKNPSGVRSSTRSRRRSGQRTSHGRTGFHWLDDLRPEGSPVRDL